MDADMKNFKYACLITGFVLGVFCTVIGLYALLHPEMMVMFFPRLAN